MRLEKAGAHVELRLGILTGFIVAKKAARCLQDKDTKCARVNKMWNCNSVDETERFGSSLKSGQSLCIQQILWVHAR